MGKSSGSENALVKYDGNKMTINKTAIKHRMTELAAHLDAVKTSMTPALLKAADEIRLNLDKLLAKGFQRVWVMGEILSKIESDTNTFGVGAVPKLAAYLRLSNETLYKWHRFYNEYDLPSVELISELRMKLSGSVISWGHVEIANRLHDNALRVQVLELAAEHDMTCDELDALVREQFEPSSKGRHGGGRPLKVPATYKGRLENLGKICHVVLRNDKKMWRHADHGFLQTIDDVPADKLPKLVGQMDKEAVRVDEAIQHLNDVRAELVKARAVAADRIDAQAKVTVVSIETNKGKGRAKGGKKGRKSATPARVPTLSETIASMGDDD